MQGSGFVDMFGVGSKTCKWQVAHTFQPHHQPQTPKYQSWIHSLVTLASSFRKLSTACLFFFMWEQGQNIADNYLNLWSTSQNAGECRGETVMSSIHCNPIPWERAGDDRGDLFCWFHRWLAQQWRCKIPNRLSTRGKCEGLVSAQSSLFAGHHSSSHLSLYMILFFSLFGTIYCVLERRRDSQSSFFLAWLWILEEMPACWWRSTAE